MYLYEMKGKTKYTTVQSNTSTLSTAGHKSFQYDRDMVVVEFTTTYAIGAYLH
jgi:hypothetical protein